MIQIKSGERDEPVGSRQNLPIRQYLPVYANVAL